MARGVRVVIYGNELDRLTRDEAVQAVLLDAGEGMARMAAAAAPKRTGRGAASIGASPSASTPTAVDVSWDQAYFYMGFQESGTSRLAARRFLQSAFERYIYL